MRVQVDLNAVDATGRLVAFATPGLVVGDRVVCVEPEDGVAVDAVVDELSPRLAYFRFDASTARSA